MQDVQHLVQPQRKKTPRSKLRTSGTLPRLKFINLTGGEPFVREDLAEIVEECYKHTDRIVISTSRMVRR